MHATVELVVSRERRRDAWSDVLIACRDERAGRSLQARARACVADTLGLPGKRPLRRDMTAIQAFFDDWGVTIDGMFATSSIEGEERTFPNFPRA